MQVWISSFQCPVFCAFQSPLTFQPLKRGPESGVSQYSPGPCTSSYTQTELNSSGWLAGGKCCKSALGLTQLLEIAFLWVITAEDFTVFFSAQVYNQSFGSNLLLLFFKTPDAMLFRPTRLYLQFQNPKHPKTKSFFLTHVMAEPDLDERKATGGLFTLRRVNIHSSGCRNLHVFGSAAPDAAVGIM